MASEGTKGEKGDTGATGPQGVQGLQGPVGPVGATGPQGGQGEQGVEGETGLGGGVYVYDANDAFIGYLVSSDSDGSSFSLISPQRYMAFFSGDNWALREGQS